MTWFLVALLAFACTHAALAQSVPPTEATSEPSAAEASVSTATSVPTSATTSAPVSETTSAPVSETTSAPTTGTAIAGTVGAESCRKCHAQEAAVFDTSIHGKNSIGCTECHGGDATKPTEDAMARKNGFKSKLKKDKRVIFEICAKCHSGTSSSGKLQPADLYKKSFHARMVLREADFAAAVCTDCHGSHGILPHTDPKSPTHRLNIPQTCDKCHGDDKRMNPYAIPTDQFKKYRISQHGSVLLAKKDTEVAVCIDCHHAHDVLPPDDPASPIFPSNVPATCGRCHENADMMSRHGHPSSIPSDYRAGVHGQALLVKGVLSAPNCASCHGNHTAVPPGFRSVVTVCGKCHPKSEENYHKSVHATIKGFKGCIECHSNHRISHPTPELFSEACVRCHPSGSPPFELGQKFRKMLLDAQAAIDETKLRIARLRASGHASDKLVQELDGARRALVALGPGLHALVVSDVEAEIKKVGEINVGVIEEVASKEWHAALRRISMGVVTLLLLFVAWIFYLLALAYEEEASKQQPTDH